jgi:hypothetical protein
VPSIFTFFKDVAITTASARREDLESLWDMQAKLAKLGHFHTSYENTQDLLLRFSKQLRTLTDQGKLSAAPL